MSLQTILESSPIAKLFIAGPIPPVANEVVGHPSFKVIAYEADRGEQPHSVAANIVSSLFFSAEESHYTEITLRKVRGMEAVYFDRNLAGELPSAVGEAVTRRLLFLSGYMEYSNKGVGHVIRVKVKGQAQTWEVRKRLESLELKRIS